MEVVVNEKARTRLTKYLIFKSVVEVLIVGVLSIGFYLTAFAPGFRGTLDLADKKHVAGWAVNLSDPHGHVEVQLYIDGRFIGDISADSARPDVLAAGKAADELHGFVFDTPALDPGEHEARVYAVHASGREQRRTLQLIGKPILFSVKKSEDKESAENQSAPSQ
jgi:hypothetical protein